MTTQRLFFALWPGTAVRRQLAATAASVCAGERGRPVPAERLHITLLFLGNVTAQIRSDVEAAAGTVSGTFFEIVLDRLGFWPRSRVVWLGAQAVPAALLCLYQDLASATAARGISIDTRPYAPHLTLIRDARRRPEGGRVAPVRWPVDSFALVASENGADGLCYRVLRAWPLAASKSP